MTMAAEVPRKPRKAGRQGWVPDSLWAKIEREYVLGEVVEQGEGEFPKLVHPSMNALARKYNITVASVAARAKKRSWKTRQESVDAQFAAQQSIEAQKARAAAQPKGLDVIDTWLNRFEAKLQDGHVAVDSLHDFERAIKLRHYLETLPNPNANAGEKTSLQELQRRHAEMRKREEQTELDPDVAGVLREDERGRGKLDLGNEDEPRALHAPKTKKEARALERWDRSIAMLEEHEEREKLLLEREARARIPVPVGPRPPLFPPMTEDELERAIDADAEDLDEFPLP